MTPIRLTAAVRLAAGAKPRRLHVLLYGGGIMSVPGFGPIAIDLAGLEIPAVVPMLTDHENAVGAVAGSGRASTDGRTLIVDGTAADTDAGREVVTLLAGGHALQASIGADPLERRPVPKGETVSVNGRELAGPFALIVRAALRECTITPLGCDPTTFVSLAAARRLKGTAMTFDEWIASIGLDPAALTDTQRAELEKAHAALYPDSEPEPTPEPEPTNAARRTASPAALGMLATEAPELVAQAAREGWSMERAQRVCLERLRASRGTGPANIITGRGTPPLTTQTLEAALMVRAGFERAAEKAYGPRVLEASRPLHRASFPDMLAHALRASGRDVPHDRTDMIRAALSGGSVTTMLSNVSGKVLESVWREAAATWRSWCAVRSASDFKEQTSIRPTFPGDLELLPEGGGIRHGTLGESTFNWRIHTFAKMYRIDRQTIVNDDLGAFSELTPSLAKAALRSLSDLVYSVLAANAGSFFHTNNGNVQTGGPSALSATSLATAVKQLRLQEDADGNVLDLAPAVLVVPPALEQTARGLLNSAEVLRDQAADLQPTGNTLQGLARLEVEGRLESGVTSPVTATTHAGSATGWYLFASPADVPMVVGFLNGKESPTVETFGFDRDPNTLAATFRVHHDFGAALGDFRAAQRSAGA